MVSLISLAVYLVLLYVLILAFETAFRGRPLNGVIFEIPKEKIGI
jgi:hypothetical protein